MNLQTVSKLIACFVGGLSGHISIKNVPTPSDYIKKRTCDLAFL